MTDVWRKDGERWSLLAPSGFEDEAALQQRIAEAPGMLPLSGQPQLAVVGSEVRLGDGAVDILAVETGGRPAVIEVKLGRNAEARRAVVAQALTYAASLHGMGVREFEDALSPRLREAGRESLADAMRDADQEGAFDEGPFREALAAHLRDGSFRVVIVLDEAPPGLVRLVGYLETITDRIALDLVTVGAYEVGGSQILLPQRIDPERIPDEPTARPPRRSGDGAVRSDGSGAFREAIKTARDDEERAALVRIADWADALEAEGLARVRSTVGKNGDRFTLIPRLHGEDSGIATGWNEGGRASLVVYRSVIERAAPGALDRIAQEAAPHELKRGGSNHEPTAGLLGALTEAYREAAAR